MLLSNTSQKIQAFIEGAPTTTNPTFSTTYADITTTSFTPGASDGALNGATAVDVIGVPAAATSRHVKELSFFNADSVGHTITVRLEDGVNSFIYGNFGVPSGSFLRYAPEVGWQIGVTIGPGTVTSVALTAPAELSVAGSPITNSGTLALTWATQAANKVFSGPPTGSAATPTFRSLVAADIPSLAYVSSVGFTANAIFTVTGSPITGSGTIDLEFANEAANLVLAGPATGAAATPTFRSLVAADIPALGYVSSVGLALPAEFTVSGSPVTGTGTLTAVWANEAANVVFAGPTTGGATTPSFRALVAADIPSLSGIYLPLAGGTMAGAINLPNGALATPSLAFNTNWGFWYDTANFLQASSTALVLDQAGASDYTWARSSTGSANFYVTSNANSANNTVWGFGTGVNTNLGQYNIRRSHGGYGAPTFPVQNDFIGDIRWSISNITSTVNSVALRGTVIDPTPSATAGGGRLICLITPVSSTTLTEMYRFDQATGFSMYGTNQVVDQNRTFIGRTYTITGLPTFVAGGMVYCSNLGGGAGMLQSDGAAWKRMGQEGYQTNSTATGAVSLSTLTNAVFQNFTATLTGNVTVTLTTTLAYTGAKFVIRTSGLGLFTFTIVNGGAGGGNLIVFPGATAQEATCVYDGTNWVLMQDSLI